VGISKSKGDYRSDTLVWNQVFRKMGGKGIVSQSESVDKVRAGIFPSLDKEGWLRD